MEAQGRNPRLERSQSVLSYMLGNHDQIYLVRQRGVQELSLVVVKELCSARIPGGSSTTILTVPCSCND